LKKGFTVVMEWQRITLHVFRRFFYPIKLNHNGTDFIVYSDTKNETEINYNRAEDYQLDDPFSRIKLIRLARAMKSLRTIEGDEKEYQVTICTNRELYDPDAEEIRYVPFDPSRLDPLEDRIKKARKKIDWERRTAS
jgi:hypothetical protein